MRGDDEHPRSVHEPGRSGAIALANKKLGMRNIRTLTAAEKRGEP